MDEVSSPEGAMDQSEPLGEYHLDVKDQAHQEVEALSPKASG